MTLINLTLRQRLSTLRWALPIGLGLLTSLYELGPERWAQQAFGAPTYLDIDIVFYCAVVPLFTLAALSVLEHWFTKVESVQRQARASEQRLASIMAASADAMIGLNPAGQIELWNHGAELLFGYTRPQIQGRPLSILFGTTAPALVEYQWLITNVRQSGWIMGHETMCHDVVGEAIEVELTATDLLEESGESLGTSVILRNITERKHREDEIRRSNIILNDQVLKRTHELAEKVDQLAQANIELQSLDRVRTEFVSVVSHQIRAPLTNMRGAFERMSGGCSLINNTCQRMLVVLDQQVDRLDRLVQDVLTANRMESGELAIQTEPISIPPVVQDIIEQIRTRIVSRPFTLLSKPGLPFALADRDRVAEVLSNLLDNADKYSPAGKEVVVEIRADQTEITVSVADHGPGIPGKDISRIFEKFYRGDNSDAQMVYGSGLGLYICQQVISAHGGHIWAENASAGGSILSFTLPVVNYN